MSHLQTPRHKAIRSIFRVLGPILLGVGLIFIIVGGINFFSVMNSFEPPRLFWCFFAGMPLIFVGFVFTSLGYMGAMARYAAAEEVPVAADAANDFAEGAQNGLRTVARSVAEGVAQAGRKHD